MRKLLIIFCGLFFSNLLIAQSNILQEKITIQVSEQPLGDVLSIIEKSSGVSFAYKSGVIDEKRKVSIVADPLPLTDILKIILFEDNVRFSAVGSQIVIFSTHEKTTIHTQSVTDTIWVRDTIWTEIKHTKYVTDTSIVFKYDTITVIDTVIERKEIKYSKPAHFISVDYTTHISNLPFTSSLNNEVIFDNGYQTMNAINVCVGRMYKKWDFSTGIGWGVEGLKINFTDYEYRYNYVADSILHTEYTYDSLFIAIPNVDTIWIVDKVPHTYYEKVIVNDTVSETSSVKSHVHYMIIPLKATYKYEINRKYALVSTLSSYTYFLLKDGYKDIEYVSKGQKQIYDLKPASVYVDAYINIGIEYAYSRKGKVYCTGLFGLERTPLFYDSNIALENNTYTGVQFGMKKIF